LHGFSGIETKRPKQKNNNYSNNLFEKARQKMSDLNDPRVLFAAERTLMAWNRTSISMMAFGFVIERFGLFLDIVGRKELMLFQRHFSFFVGVSFILLASFVSLYFR